MVPGSTIGSSSVSQAISALERWRTDNHHLYKDNPEAQIGLRSDNRVRVIEAASKRNEPSRIESSQALKAAGTSSGRYFAMLFGFVPLALFLPLFYAQTPTLLKSWRVAPGGVWQPPLGLA